MTLLWRALTAFALIFSANGAAFATALVPSGALFAQEQSRVPLWTAATLCNGISKHTRTICCGSNPPAWCGKRPEGDIVPHEADHETDNSVRYLSAAPLTRAIGRPNHDDRMGPDALRLRDDFDNRYLLDRARRLGTR